MRSDSVVPTQSGRKLLLIMLVGLVVGCSSQKSNRTTTSYEIITFAVNHITVSAPFSVENHDSIYLSEGRVFGCGMDEIANHLKEDFKAVEEWKGPKLHLRPNGDTARIQTDEMGWKFSIVQIRQDNVSLKAEDITGSKNLKINMEIGEWVLLERKRFQLDEEIAYKLFFLSPCGGIKEPVKSTETDITKLIEQLKDKNYEIRGSAALALAEIGKPAVESLIEVLKDEDRQVRFVAVRILGEIEDKSAVEPLIEALRDEDELVRNVTAVTLQRLTGQDFGEDYDKWLKWWEENKNK